MRDLRFVFCSHSYNYSQCKCACTLGMFAAQSGPVLMCLVGWPDGVLGRDLCHLITCGVESGGAASSLHNHIQSTAAKNDPIKVLRPSIHHRWESSNARWGRTPASVPRAAGHPLFGYRKIAKINWVLEFDWSTTYFLYQTLQNQAAISDHI